MSRQPLRRGLRRRRGDDGFTLIEVFAVVMIVVVALLGASAALLSASRLEVETNRVRTASRAASSVIERLRSADFSTLVSRYQNTKIPLSQLDDSAGDAGWVLIHVVESGTSGDAPLYDVSLTVSVDGTTESNVDVVTQISDRVVGTPSADPTQYAANSPLLGWQ